MIRKFLSNAWTRAVIAGALIGAALAPVAQAAWTLNVPYHPDQLTGDIMALRVTGGKTELLSIPAVAAGQVLISSGTSTAPAWSATAAVNAITPASGTLTITGIFANVGAGSFSGALAANGGITVDTTAFTVADTTGNVTTTGTLTFGDAAGDAHVQQGTLSGLRTVATRSTSTGAQAATVCGGIYVGAATSGTMTYTLPAVALSGCQVTFIAGHADTEILVNAAASATCVITTFTAVGADADTAIVTDASCDTGLKNTAASNAVGDSLVLVSDGTGWFGVGMTSGIWTTQ